MPIEISLAGLLGTGAADEAQAAGVLDPEQVLIQFLCETDGGGHDPDGEPDDHVRPAHAALHGTLWRIDDASAPIPPLDYGCRCAIRYVGKKGTQAARVFGVTADEPPERDAVAAYREWLDKNADGWKDVAKAGANAAPPERLSVATAAAKKLGIDNPRDVARMAVEASPYPMKAAGPLGTSALTGLGKSGKALVDRWRAGDVTAAAKLAKSYPATYQRLLLEEPRLMPVQ